MFYFKEVLSFVLNHADFHLLCFSFDINDVLLLVIVLH